MIQNTGSSCWYLHLSRACLAAAGIAGSIILDQLRTRKAKDPKVSTFLKTYSADKSDKGRDFGSLSKLEDYVIKMAFTANGYMTIPTMGDKNTFYVISGFEMPSMFNGDSSAVYFEQKDPDTGMIRSGLNIPNAYLQAAT